MIESSPTARRAENAATITPADEKSAERYALYERAKVERPRCEVCGCRVRYAKAAQQSPRCDRHEENSLSKTDQRHLDGAQSEFVALPNFAHERKRRKVSRKEILRRSGVPPSNQLAIETGGRTRVGRARALALALGVSVDELRTSRGEV